MKKQWTKLFTIGVLCGTGVSAEAQNVLSFPGAEGFGRYTSGGRGGKIYLVTKTSDDGSEGTLRYALNQKGPRYIIFKTGGTIYLQSPLKIHEGNVTIAGQTAPGDGITIANYETFVAADNVIIR
ncbi:MAG: pectate lyase, partial [Chryseobacterium sp.]|nr:pectate lyase [Chryseobacterium sp.]